MNGKKSKRYVFLFASVLCLILMVFVLHSKPFSVFCDLVVYTCDKPVSDGYVRFSDIPSCITDAIIEAYVPDGLTCMYSVPYHYGDKYMCLADESGVQIGEIYRLCGSNDEECGFIILGFDNKNSDGTYSISVDVELDGKFTDVYQVRDIVELKNWLNIVNCVPQDFRYYQKTGEDFVVDEVRDWVFPSKGIVLVSKEEVDSLHSASWFEMMFD